MDLLPTSLQTQLRHVHALLPTTLTSISLAIPSPLHISIFQTRIPLLQLPQDVILCIVDQIPRSSLMAFALSSRAAYTLSIPKLNQSIVLAQQNIPSFLLRTQRSAYINGYIRRLQLGRLDIPGYAEKWDVAEIAETILSSCTMLREIETVGCSYVKGWSGLDRIAKAVGSHLSKLDITMGALDIPSSAVVSFPNVKHLTLKIAQQGFTGENVEGAFQPRFPAVKIFEVAFPPTSRSMDTLMQFMALPETTFPFLHTLRVFLTRTEPNTLFQPELTPLFSFLTRHATTLRSLHLPPILPSALTLPDLSNVTLEHLHCSIFFAIVFTELCHAPTVIMQSLHLLDMDMGLSASDKEAYMMRLQASLGICYSVRTFTITSRSETFLKACSEMIPNIFPNLEEFCVEVPHTFSRSNTDYVPKVGTEVLRYLADNTKKLRVVYLWIVGSEKVPKGAYTFTRIGGRQVSWTYSDKGHPSDDPWRGYHYWNYRS